jgi:hypothetical protein
VELDGPRNLIGFSNLFIVVLMMLFVILMKLAGVVHQRLAPLSLLPSFLIEAPLCPRVLHVNRPFLEPTNKQSRQPILILKRYNHGNKFLETTRQPILILKRHNHGNTLLDTTRHTIIRTSLPANHNRWYHSKMGTSSLIYTMRRENFILLLCTTNIPQRHMS